VTVAVSAANDAPAANDDMASVGEDSGANFIGTLANDSDLDGDTLSVAAVTQGGHGAVAIAPGGVTYTPTPNFVGSDSFTYTISDGNGGSDSAIVTVVVTNANDAPLADADSATVAEDSANTPINVLANDTDLDGDSLTVTAVTPGTNGSVAIAGSAVTYTPNPNYFGSDSFTYTIADGNGGSATAAVTVTVTAVNDSPVANTDAASVVEDSANNPIDVLANDTDVDGDSLKVSAVTQGANGTVAMGDGGVSYTPRANFVGSDSFSYTISDGHGGSATASVTVAVTNANDTPAANDDQTSVAEDSADNVIDVLANDTDPDGDTLTIAAVTQGSHGSVTIAAGAVSYTPNPNFVGSDSFTYTIGDTDGGTDSATVTVTITNANDAPTAAPDAATVAEDSVNSSIDVLANDTDSDGDTLTITAVTQGAHGSVAIAGRALTYTPHADYFGADSFSYTIDDGQGGSATADVTVTVTGVNDAPVAVSDAFTTAEDLPAAGNVLANDTDTDGGALTAALGSGPASGVLGLNADGSFTYTPNANFSGVDSFTYTVSDGDGGSDSATVTITIDGANDAPVAMDDAAMTAEDTPVSGNVLANDVDADGNALSAVLVDGPAAAAGTLVFAPDGSFSFTPAANFNGAAVFTYRASDAAATSNIATVTIGVTPGNDGPTADDDNYFARSGALLIVGAPGVLGNDADVDGGVLTASVVATTSRGELTLSAGGGFTYMPAPGFTGVDSFTYLANDGALASNAATVTILVASELVVAQVEGEERTVTTDPAGTGPTPADPLEASVTSPVDGTITIADTAAAGEAPAGYSLFGTQVIITAPTATSANPLLLVFTLDGSVIPAGQNEHTVVVFRNGVPVIACDSAADSSASPDPCVASRALVNGDIRLSVRTSAASAWGFGTSQANVAPVADNDSYTVNEGEALVVSAPGVLVNDSDGDRHTLSAAKVGNPAHGAATLNADGSFTYTPGPGFSGTDSFTYKVSDGQSDSNVATVSITVNATRRPPVAHDDAATVVEDSGANAIDVLVNDSDADGDALKITAVTQGASGSVVIAAGGGGLTYAPNANFAGSDSFTYTITDGTAFATATVAVNVTAVNDNPDAIDDTVAVLEGSVATTLAVLANDTTIEAGETLTINAVTQPGHGSVTISGGTAVRYTPDAAFEGTDSFSYTIQDGNGGVDTATATVTVQSKPGISINDVEVVEGSSGFTTATYTVRLSHPVVAPITVKFATADGMARAGQDYEAASGTVTFAPGEVTRPLVVKVIGDTTKERNEVFAVTLGGPTNGDIARGTGYATILDDDSSQTATNDSNSGPGGGDRFDALRLRPLDDQVDRAGDRVKLDLKFRRGDLDDVTVHVEGLPEGLRYDVEEHAIVGRLSRSESAGDYTITVRISNGRSESMETFDWTVRPSKDAS
jgi:VCBS repeat-containing protein